MAQEGAAADGTPPPVTPSPASDKSPRTPTPSPSHGPDAVVALGLSYPTHLVGALSTVKRRGAEAQTECGELARAMKDLAAVEKTYAQGLAAIAGRVAPCCGHDHRSGRDAPTLVDELVDAVRGASDLPPGFVNDALVLSVVLSPFQARRVVIDAIVDAERRAEDDHFEAREAEERGANQRAVTDAAREEQVRLTEEMDGEFTDDETGSDED